MRNKDFIFIGVFLIIYIGFCVFSCFNEKVLELLGSITTVFIFLCTFIWIEHNKLKKEVNKEDILEFLLESTNKNIKNFMVMFMEQNNNIIYKLIYDKGITNFIRDIETDVFNCEEKINELIKDGYCDIAKYKNYTIIKQKFKKLLTTYTFSLSFPEHQNPNYKKISEDLKKEIEDLMDN